MKRNNDLAIERVKLLFCQKSLKRQLQLRSGDGDDIKDWECRLDGAVTRMRRSQTTNESLREQLRPLWYNVDKNCQRLHLYTEKYIMDVFDRFSGFFV